MFCRITKILLPVIVLMTLTACGAPGNGEWQNVSAGKISPTLLGPSNGIF